MLLNNASANTDEEKRKLYVGFTRAKNALYIHFNRDIFRGDLPAGIERIEDLRKYSEPAELILPLTHRGVVLNYFKGREGLTSKLRSGQELRVVTNNLNVANTLTLRKNHLYYIGGQIIVSNGVYHTTSPTIADELEKLYIKKAFIGVSGISLNSGFTINNAYQVNLYKSVMEIADEVIVLCDHTKFGLQRMYRLALAKNVKTLITTGTVPDEYMRKFSDMGLTVICA